MGLPQALSTWAWGPALWEAPGGLTLQGEVHAQTLPDSSPGRAAPHACHQPWEMPALLSAFLIPRCKRETEDLLKAHLVNSTWLPLELGKQLRTELKRTHTHAHANFTKSEC